MISDIFGGVFGLGWVGVFLGRSGWRRCGKWS